MRASILLLAWTVCGPALAEEIRVELRRGVATVQIGAVAAARGAAGPLALARPFVRATARNGKVHLGKKAVQPPLVLRPGAEPLRLDGKPLPGRLEIWPEEGALAVINVVDLEDYVAAVVASEMPPGWPDAALQAQAVAARTYAVTQKIAAGQGARAHLGATVLDQVYAGQAGQAARAAAQATRGQVLTHGAVPIQAFFSASCGGKSESAEAAFNLPSGSVPYLPGQPDGDADDGAPTLRWTRMLPLSKVTSVLKRVDRVRGPIKDIQVVQRTASGRASKLRVSTKRSHIEMSAAELRQLLGYRELPSLLFDVRVQKGAAVFEGRGLGHGAGLCQWGARGRAAKGQGYREILAHYYPGAEIRPLY